MIRIILYILFLLPVFTFAADPPLNGTKTIGSASANDYQTFAEAISAMETAGIDGEIEFKLVDAFYDEPIILTHFITGSSSTNTITFYSAGQTEITNSGGSWVISIDVAEHIIFTKLTFIAPNLGQILNSTFSLGNISFIKNVFNGSANLAFPFTNQDIIYASLSVDNVVFTDNDFNNGSNGLGLYVNAGGSGTSIEISGNTFSTKGSAIALQISDAPNITNNTITNNSNSYAIILNYIINDFTIEKNKINTTTTDGSGIKLINITGTSSLQGSVINNFIQAGDKGLTIEGSSYIDVIHNSINIATTSNTPITSSSAFESITNTDLVLYNNIFNNKREGYAYIGLPAHFVKSDFNNVSTNGIYHFNWNGTDYKTLPLLQQNNNSTNEDNSKSVEVVFASKSDMHIVYVPEMLNGFTTSVIKDIDGDNRTPIRFMGADEFLGSPLNGIYTVGVGGHFNSITLALAYMYDFGISGAVTFNILSGTYNEQINLDGAISGSSATNVVTFQSNSGNASDVIITNSSGSSVINIEAAEHIVFNKLTFTAPNLGKVLNLNSPGISLNFLNFTNNIFNGSVNLSSFPSSQDIIFALASTIDNVIFTNNTFNNGYQGIRLIASNAFGTFVDISDNTFSTNGLAISLSFLDAPNIVNNIITNNSDSYGIALSYIHNDFAIIGNKINTTTNTGSGIFLQSITGTSIKHGKVRNNLIQAANKGITLKSTTYIDFLHNSINIENATHTNEITSTAFEGIDGSYINATFYNNIFANKRGGYSCIGISGANNISDYNDLYTTGTNIGKWDNVNQPTLVDYISASSTNNNSVSANPFYFSLSDLHANSPQIDNEGTLALSFPDIDGQPRSSNTPSIGADEFTVVALPLSEVYTIGTGGDYATISNAVADLYSKGVGGEVVFQIFNGNYTDQIDLDGAITGSSATNTVTFQSNSGNVSDVEITHTAIGTADNFVVRIKVAEYLKFKNLTLTAGGTDYAKVVSLENVNGNLELYGNVMNGYVIPPGSANLENLSVISCNSTSKLNNSTFENNIINNGARGIYFDLDDSSTLTSNLLVKNCSIINVRSVSIYIENADAPKIESNTCNNNNGFGISLKNCNNDFVVEKNIISVDVGIKLLRCDGTDSKHGTIKNNFIIGETKGITLDLTKYVDVYYNTIFLEGIFSSSTALLVRGNSEYLSIKDNIFYNNHNGSAIEWESGIINECNYNNLYATGPTLVKHGPFGSSIDYATLADWQAAPEGFDVNSKNATVTFASPTDLHIVSTSVPLNGIQITGIITDIDGDTRNDPPFMGADEPVLSEIDLSLTIMLEGPYSTPEMNASLTVPFDSPYTEDPETVNPIPNISGNEVVDWVLVELRDETNSSIVLESQSAFVLKDGSVVGLDGVSPVHFTSSSGNYFVSVKHRNHLAVMSASAVGL
ncbi:MAG: right-handed parallel beta-helix repeat-containing protein [Melioribacteraceae bacterium]